MTSEFSVIGITGKATAGKTTTANYLVEKYNFHRTAFAKLLKEVAHMMYPWLTKEQLYGDLKMVVDDKLGKSPREVLQLLGTEVGRLIWDNTWVDGVLRDIEDIRTNVAPIVPIYGVVVDDVRFPNEVEAIRSVGGEIWSLVRSDIDAVVGISGHASEAYAEEFSKNADYVIHNDGTLEDLYASIDKHMME